MYSIEHKPIVVGGEKLINWKFLACVLPVIMILTPITENDNGNGWTFWRWTLAAILGVTPIVVFYFVGDVILFHSRSTKPVKSIFVFIFGLFLGASHGLSTTYAAHILRLVNEGYTQELIEKTINSALIGLLVLPLSSLISASYESYRFDRNQLISERLAAQSKKAESQAVLKGLRISMSKKVDENLLEVLQSSKEYFEQKNRSLDQNWELMAEKLRSAALETVRPFSHSLHKKGTERQYSVRPSEIFRYTAHSINIHIPWVLLIYGVTTYTDIYTHSNFQSGSFYLILRLTIISILLVLMRFLKLQGYFRKLPSFLLLLAIFCGAFALLNIQLDDYFNLKYQQIWNSVANAVWLGAVIFAVGLISAFIDGQAAEMEFIRSQLSSAEISSLLVKREEARISRELAKYLHGTIQSRLMASAMEVERAGRSGDKSAIDREIAKAYKTLTLPDESYFSAPEETLGEELKKVAAKWNHLLKIRISLSKNLPELESNISQDIGNVVNEALANSFRHGEATSVSITITKIKNDVLIQISDNGVGISKGKPGLGTDAFTALAGSAWKLTKSKNGSGTLLTLRLENVFS